MLVPMVSRDSTLAQEGDSPEHSWKRNTAPLRRELYILFGRINGLRNKCPGTSCTYQLVLDAIATDLVVQPILDIDVSCSFPHGGCARRILGQFA